MDAMIVHTFKRAHFKLNGERDIHHSLEVFVETYRITQNSAVPDNKTEIFYGRKLTMSMNFLKPPVNVIGRDIKI